MYKLTDRRLEQAKVVLDRAASHLAQSGHLEASGLERDLRKIWGIGYQELKSIFIDMYKRHPDYRLVAIRYMESSGHGPHPVMEFKRHLAEAYQIPSYDHHNPLEARKQFWKGAIGDSSEIEAFE